MVKTQRVHCNIKHVDAYMLQYDDGRIVVKCPHKPYCQECPIEKGIIPKRQRI